MRRGCDNDGGGGVTIERGTGSKVQLRQKPKFESRKEQGGRFAYHIFGILGKKRDGLIFEGLWDLARD
jgi:hypothetical protein